MTQIVYTALRELTGIVLDGGTAILEIGISEYSTSRAVVKDAHRSKGGARETLYHRADVTHNITFQPVNNFEKKQLREFLASTESGEAFSIYLYGTESAPIRVTREDEGSSENMFMAVGSADGDYMQASITVMEE
jgi:hypothetical protein